MENKIESYKTRIDRICNKVQRMVDDLELSKSKKNNMTNDKMSLKDVVNDVLSDDEISEY